jgi:two-component system, chemotaxis family, chemotaxis protein CheY
MRILIAEDDVTSQLLLKTFLSKYGECHLAVNGKEAVAAFRTGQESGKNYDLVCMDIMMPEMDGQTAVQEIRELEKAGGSSSAKGAQLVMTNGAKIIMTTALNDVKNVFQAFHSLCDAYLFKPIDTAKLLAHLREFHLI